MEQWKDIKGYEGLYQVSSLGRVKRILFKNKMVEKKEDKVLKPFQSKKGYLQVTLCKNNKTKLFNIHRLVAEAFIDNPDNLPQVNHRDENKENNKINNLEFCTSKYNHNYGTGIKRQSEQLKKKVNQYDLNGNFIKCWDGMVDAQNELGINRNNINSCCLNTRKTAGGFIWKYHNSKEEREVLF